MSANKGTPKASIKAAPLDLRGAALAMWMAQRPKAQALIAAWRAHGTKDDGIELLQRNGPSGRIFAVRCANGLHESTISHEDALEKLVDAHRTMVEDLGSTRDLIWWAESDADAHEVLRVVVAEVKVAAPHLVADARDAAVLERVAELDTAERDARKVTMTAAEIAQLRDAHPDAWANDRRSLFH